MRRDGFTIIELLVVIAILVILISVGTPYISDARAGAKSACCLERLREIGKALETYALSYHDYYPFPGTYEEVYKPCPEYLLHDEVDGASGIFSCPEDERLHYSEAVREYGEWTAQKFWPQGGEMPSERYVRDMWRFDRNTVPGRFAVERMESSYMWCEHVVSEPTMRSSILSPGDLGLVSEGRCVVNRWVWSSLDEGEDCRRDQQHRGDSVNVLCADTHAQAVPLSRVGKVRCDPRAR